MGENLRQILDDFKIPISLGLIGVILILLGLLFSTLNKPSQSSFPKESLVEAKKISVDVSGAVTSPGVYKFDEGSRIETAITAAGGFKENVNKEYISKYLNMAQKLSDGSKIYIPVEGESQAVTQAMVAGVSVDAKVNINSAAQAELEALPGIGPVTASKIISDRPYQKVEDLLNKKIVSKATFKKIKDSIVVY